MALSQIERKVLKKLMRHTYVGKRHTAKDNIPKGFPKDERGDVRKAIKSLVRNGYLIEHPTSYGIHVSIDPARTDEVKEILGIG
ncbi:MAG: hypothetical protein QMC85_02705 [Methanocellales archaeon]|nr:hypothetical protein [Methanocellales archaeon]